MAEQAKKKKMESSKSSYSDIIERFNKSIDAYSGALPAGAFNDAFYRAAYGMANIPQLQNSRVKGISSLPADYTKEEIGEFLRNPYQNERGLRQTSEILRWTAYPYYKIIKTYADIPTYRYYTKPLYAEKSDFENADFMREAKLVDKFCKEFRPSQLAHEAVGKALESGKVFYTYRYEVDKTHNKVRAAFWQQLPTDWCWVIGKNNISGWTVSFDMMYFLQPGTDYRAFGDLFEPFVEDFNALFEPKEANEKREYVYASQKAKVDCKGSLIDFYPNNYNANANGNPKMFMQNGRWFYYVSLPVDKVFGFEIDDTTANVASSLSGLMLTYAQQSDYEAAQMSLLLNPLIKIFTGTIPLLDDVTKSEDRYKVSLGARVMFESFFNTLMSSNNTGGAAFYSAPFSDIKSHDFKESANANEISESFNRYGMEKAGLAGIIPATDDVKAAQVGASMSIESRFATATIYPQMERMMNVILSKLNLKHDWCFKMFGTIFTDEKDRENAKKMLDIGDTSAIFTLSALEGESWLDKLTMLHAINASGIMDNLIVPQTAYTQSGEAGRPQTDGISDAKEKSIDAGNSPTD